MLEKRIMKNVLKIFLLCISSALFAACSQPVAPDVVAVRLFNAVTSGDMDYVKENIYLSHREDINVVNEFLTMMASSPEFKKRTEGYTADYRATAVNYAGDEAWVELKGKGVSGEMITTITRMVFVDGRWLVDGDYSILHAFNEENRK